MFITEKLQTPITASCDVLVCGGGFAGISAALAAARQGKKVILLEKQYMLVINSGSLCKGMLRGLKKFLCFQSLCQQFLIL